MKKFNIIYCKNIIKEFGIFFTIKYYIYILIYGLSFKLTHKLYKRDSYIQLIKQYLSREYLYDINEYNSKSKERYLIKKDYKIWVLWWQGKDNMPPIVDLCFNNLLKKANGLEVIFLDKDNFKDYINLPDFILKKFNEGKITIPQLSDIFRFYLLYNYGGLWIDSTVWVSKDLSSYNILFENSFFTIKRKEKKDSFYVSKNKWTGYLMGTNKVYSEVFGYGLNLFYKYWKEHNILIDYFLIDYFIDILYERTTLGSNLNRLPFNNENVDDLNLFLNQNIDDKYFEKLINKTIFYKMSWKSYIDFEKKESVYSRIKNMSK